MNCDYFMSSSSSSLSPSITSITIFSFSFLNLLADRILLLLHSVIGYWKNPVACLSVCLSVMLCIVALGVGVRGYKLYCSVFLAK